MRKAKDAFVPQKEKAEDFIKYVRMYCNGQLFAYFTKTKQEEMDLKWTI